MRKILGLIVVLFLSATPGVAYAQSHWSCDIYQYQYSMSVYYSLENINNISDYEVAAFVGNECRGVGKVLSTDGQTYGYIRVRSNKTSRETVSFMIYDKKNKLEHAINTTLAFKTDAAIGYPSSPTMLEVSIIDEDPIGDANGDGVVNAADIVAVICDIKGHTPVRFVKKAADVNKDNNIDNSDVEAIANIIMKEQ